MKRKGLRYFFAFLCTTFFSVILFSIGGIQDGVRTANAATTLFATGWEAGQERGLSNQVAYSHNVAGYFNSASPPPESGVRLNETVRSGNYSLLLAGYSRAAYAYCYYRIFDQDIPVHQDTTIGYWIYHQQGTAKIAVDGHFKDGTTIRDFGGGVFTDQHGVRIHPGQRNDPMNQWVYVEVDLSAAAGKTLDYILFAFDNGGDGFTGPYRAYVDDFRIFEASDADDCIQAVSADHWQGVYFNNLQLGGEPVLVRDDGAGFLDFNWGTGSPGSDCGLGTDRFSVRWTRDVNLPAGTYRFTVTGDDGVRLYVDDALKLDRWIDQAPTTYTVDVSLAAGYHTLELEYYENGGGAVVKLVWQEASQLPTSSKSKLTIHTSFLGPESMWFIEQAKPTVVKILDEVKVAQQVKAVSPHTLIVGRIWYDPWQKLGNGDPAGRAQEWWQNVRQSVEANPAVDYWEGYNEPVIHDAGLMDWYARFEKERVQILATNGYKACIGNFSTGMPPAEQDVWRAFYPAIDAALQHGGILGLHEYSAPDMDWLYDYALGEGWLTGRYRKVYRQFLIPDGRKISLIITECGIDGGVMGEAGKGWRSYQDADHYFEQLKWYDSLLREDDYVLGATIFSLEIPGWGDFDIRGRVRELLTDYVRTSGQ